MLRVIVALWLAGCATDRPSSASETSEGGVVETIFAASDGTTCLDGELAQPLSCTAYDAQNLGTGSQVEYLLPNCAYADGALPCWTTTLAPDMCVTTPSQYDVAVTRDEPPADNLYTIVACAAR